MNPSGKLPYTIALAESDYAFANITNSSALLQTQDPNAWQSDFEERLLIDYSECVTFVPSLLTDRLQDTSITSTSLCNTNLGTVYLTRHSQ